VYSFLILKKNKENREEKESGINGGGVAREAPERGKR
jgi:hypothetical protein